jgi:hypothetical protein
VEWGGGLNNCWDGTCVKQGVRAEGQWRGCQGRAGSTRRLPSLVKDTSQNSVDMQRMSGKVHIGTRGAAGTFPENETDRAERERNGEQAGKGQQPRGSSL